MRSADATNYSVDYGRRVYRVPWQPLVMSFCHATDNCFLCISYLQIIRFCFTKAKPVYGCLHQFAIRIQFLPQACLYMCCVQKSKQT